MPGQEAIIFVFSCVSTKHFYHLGGSNQHDKCFCGETKTFFKVGWFFFFIIGYFNGGKSRLASCILIYLERVALFITYSLALFITTGKESGMKQQL